jgi:hypothetical protein
MNERELARLPDWLNELEESKSWVHHTAELGRGKLLTFPLERPVAPLARVANLSRLGRVLDASIFGGPSYDLTPHRPYHHWPPAGLSASGADLFDVFWADFPPALCSQVPEIRIRASSHVTETPLS